MGNAASGAMAPQQIMMNFVLGMPVSLMIGTAARLGIPKLLESGPATADVVARRTKTPPETTYRLMRALATLGVLTENAERAFALTPVGECLLPDRPGSFDALAQMNTTPFIAGAYFELPYAVETGKSAFSKHHGQGLFAWLAEHPAEQELFGRAMSTFSGMEMELVLGAYDFTNARHVVDVGGGHGMLLSRVLQAAPDAQGTLFDQPDVVARAKTSFVAKELAARCEVIGGDFFQSVPSGGDVYLLKHILHDWDDERALRILKSVATAMKPGSRLLVIEQGIAPPGVPNPGKVMDVIMLMLLDGGRERSAEEHAALFEQAGIRFEREIPTPGPITLFEGVRS
jgi:hypothetical protein